MSNETAELVLEKEEAARGQDLQRAPGGELMAAQARDQAEASGWIAEGNLQWPFADARQGVIERRQELYEAMGKLESVTARPSGLADWRIEVEAALTDLDRRLQAHIESANGLFARILVDSPHLAPRIVELEDEHSELRTACRSAVSMAADWSSSRLRRKVNLLLARLAIHRQNGAELVFDAYNVDIATGD